MNVGFGSTVLWRDRGSGKFFCSACGGERDYLHRQSRRWFRFGIPLIPGAKIEDLYRCQTCHREFDEHFLTEPPTSDLATRLQRTARAGAVTAMLDGDPEHQPSRLLAIETVKTTGLRYYSETDLDADLRSMDITILYGEAQQLVRDLELGGRERLLVDVGNVALASGQLTQKNRAMLDQLGRALDLSPGTVHRLLTQLDQGQAAVASFKPWETG